MTEQPWDEFSERLRDLETMEFAPDIISPYLALPGLRGFWPMSSFNEFPGDAFDMSGQGRTMAKNGNPTYNYDGLVPYLEMSAGGDFLRRTDEPGLDILGTEAYIAAAARGLTMGLWLWRDGLVNNEGFMAKRAGANDGYALYGSVTGAFRCVIGTGAAQQLFATTDVDATAVFAANAWHFTVMRFDPSTTISIYVDGTNYSIATAIAAINNSAADLDIGQIVGGVNLDGRVSLCFLCAMVLSDSIVNSLFQQTRAAFGV